MRHFKFLLSFCLAVSSVVAQDVTEVSDPVVTTTSGQVRGNILTSLSGRNFYSFRGIRYTKPPLGPLRFKDPLPVEPWNEIFDATKDGPICPQRWNNSADMDEDCVRLNIFTHNIPSESKPNNTLKPVIVWLHPGGFYAMGGHSEFFAGPQYLMNRDIVLVTLNYRLGSLGFLATGTRDVPGNAGFKDQVIALRWIKDNIARFGGNPNSVTLLGYSAGSVSITLHMVSPMSKDLFHKAIIMSGSAIPNYIIPTEQLFLAQRQARLLNCTETIVSDMINCMRTRPYIDFPNTFDGMFWIGGLPVLLYKPVIEPDFGQERFIAENTVKSYQEGSFTRIPLIIGMVKDEFLNIAYDILGSPEFSQQMDENWDEYAPIILSYEEHTPRSKNISETLRREFVGPEPLSFNNSMPGLGYLINDALMGFSINRLVKLVARCNKVYYYHFSYQGRWSYFMLDGKPVGVAHQDDSLYLLTQPSIAPTFTPDYPEHVTMQRLTRMWTAFAEKGDPNMPNDEYLADLRWEPYTFQRKNYLDIGENMVMKQNLYAERFAVWERLFPLTWPPHHHHHGRRGGKHPICHNHSDIHEHRGHGRRH